MPSHVFQIEDGKFGLSIVDTAAVGYDPGWQAPGGKSATTAVIADYTSGGLGDFTCQVTSGALTASPNTSDDTTPATFCGPEETVTNVGVTSYAVDTTFLQDPDLVNGLNRFLFEQDTREAFFYLALANDVPPKAIGRCRIIAGTIGGDARTTLTATLSLPCSRKPDVAFGTASGSVIIPGGGGAPVPTPATIATAGIPGGFNGTPPQTLAGMSSVTASPQTAWTTGQYVVLGDSSHAHWDSSAWVVGDAT
jgi:hypothetical protein